jgi:hypothetical protein
VSKAKAVVSVTGDQHYIPHAYIGSTLRANARTQLAWSYGTETVLTDARGWRIGEGVNTPSAADVLAVGCSWGMGVGSNYEDTISANLERLCDIPVGNASVGSFSLLQMVRRTELTLNDTKPRLAVLLYGHWQLDRCFKRNAYADIVERPIFMRGADGGLIVREPPTYASLLVQAYLRLYRRVRSGRAKRGDARLLKLLKASCRLTGLRFRDVRQALSGTRHGWVGSKDADWHDLRAKVLRYCLTELLRMARGHGTKILIQHMYEYVHFGTPQWEGAETDRELLRSQLRELDPSETYLVYRDWAVQEQGFSRYLQETHGSLQGLIYTENFHPTSIGYRLIAEGIAPAIQQQLRTG